MSVIQPKHGTLFHVVWTAVVAAILVSAVMRAFSAGAIEIDVAPPPPRAVKVPAPRPGFVWAPGYYRWDGHAHIWVDGHFIRERRGARWVPEHWDKHRDRYRFVPGRWESG